jgi:hypothetical protein
MLTPWMSPSNLESISDPAASVTLADFKRWPHLTVLDRLLLPLPHLVQSLRIFPHIQLGADEDLGRLRTVVRDPAKKADRRISLTKPSACRGALLRDGSGLTRATTWS